MVLVLKKKAGRRGDTNGSRYYAAAAAGGRLGSASGSNPREVSICAEGPTQDREVEGRGRRPLHLVPVEIDGAIERFRWAILVCEAEECCEGHRGSQ